MNDKVKKNEGNQFQTLLGVTGSGKTFTMAKEDINILDYIVGCISEFASRYEMNMRDAYIYLSRNKGIEFLKEFYDVEHALSFDDVLDNLAAICIKNGGAVS